MNTYARMKNTSEETSGRGKAGTQNKGMWGLAVKVIMIGLLIFGAVFARIVFKAKTENLNKEAVRIEWEINKLKLETMHLRNRKAALSARPCIMRKIGKIGLRAPEYSQIQYVALLKSPRRSSVKENNAYAGIPQVPQGEQNKVASR